MANRLWLVTPCYYDSASLFELVKRVRSVIGTSFPELQTTIVCIDDSGGADGELFATIDRGACSIQSTPYNLGHQGALVFGLRTLADLISDEDYVVTMDSDGEDRPEDIPELISPLRRYDAQLELVVLAQRTKRTESLAFKTLYAGFKLFFSTLTGKIVRNGNFAAYRGWYARNVLNHPYFDYCYSSSLLALSRRIFYVPLARGRRYCGTSKMTITTLVMHGLRMLLPFSEHIAVRTLFAACLLLGASILALWYSLWLIRTGLEPAAIGLTLSALSFVIAVVSAATAMTFFQIVSQTRAISLRKLTSEHNGSPIADQASSQDFHRDSLQDFRPDSRQDSRQDLIQDSRQALSQNSRQDLIQDSRQALSQDVHAPSSAAQASR